MKGILFIIGRIYSNQLKRYYLRDEIVFFNIFCRFCNLHQILNILKKKKMTLIAYIFRKLRTAKNVVRKKSKNSGFRIPFDSQHVKKSQKLLRPAWQHFSHIFASCFGRLSNIKRGTKHNFTGWKTLSNTKTMYLEVKLKETKFGWWVQRLKRKMVKDGWFICTLKYSKNVRVRLK